MDIGLKIRELRVDRRMTQKDLAEKMGIVLATVSSYETNNSQPNIDKLIHLSKVFGVSVDEIIGNSGIPIFQNNGSKIYRAKSIKYYDIDASAGQTTMFDPGDESFNKEIIVPGFGDCDFALNVWGDSMHPTLKNGSIVICKEWKESFFEYGHIYLIVTRENHRMIKYINPGKTEETISCESENTFFKPFEIQKQDVLKIYLVKGSVDRSSI